MGFPHPPGAVPPEAGGGGGDLVAVALEAHIEWHYFATFERVQTPSHAKGMASLTMLRKDMVSRGQGGHMGTPTMASALLQPLHARG